MEPLTFEQLIGEAFMDALKTAEITIQGLAVVLAAFGLVALIIFAGEALSDYRKSRNQ